jgi:hypothetical protein
VDLEGTMDLVVHHGFLFQKSAPDVPGVGVEAPPLFSISHIPIVLSSLSFLLVRFP